MSTELKSRSKAYELTRVSIGRGMVGVVVSQGWNRPSMTFSIPEIKETFASSFNRIQSDLNLLDETMPLLQADLAQFALTGGNGMEAY